MALDKFYFTPDLIFSYQALLNYVVGMRSCGKTYGSKAWALNRFIKKGEQFVYLRRYHEELKDAPTFFDDIASDDRFIGHELKVRGRTFYCDGKICGWARELSKSQSKKSTPMPKVSTIIFDEFIIEEGNIYYLQNEVEKLLSFMHTVFRNRPGCRVICLANSIKWNNPHFAYWKFYPRDEKSYIERKKKGTVLLQVYDNEDFRNAQKENAFYTLIEGTRYADMAINNRFKDVNDDFIAKKPPDAWLEFNISWRGSRYGVWINREASKFYVSRKNNPQYVTLAFTASDHKPNMRLLTDRSNPNTKLLRQAFQNSYLYFEDEYIRQEMYDLMVSMGIRR